VVAGDGGGAGWWCDRDERKPKTVAKPSTFGGIEDDGSGGGERLARLYNRVEACFSRVVEPGGGNSGNKLKRESSFSRVRRLLSLSKLLSTTNVDLTLLHWKARRHRSGSGFNHFLDLVIVLAGKLGNKLLDEGGGGEAEGAEAVEAVLDELEQVRL